MEIYQIPAYNPPQIFWLTGISVSLGFGVGVSVIFIHYCIRTASPNAQQCCVRQESYTKTVCVEFRCFLGGFHSRSCSWWDRIKCGLYQTVRKCKSINTKIACLFYLYLSTLVCHKNSFSRSIKNIDYSSILCFDRDWKSPKIVVLKLFTVFILLYTLSFVVQ